MDGAAMNGRIIDGKAFAEGLRRRVAASVAELMSVSTHPGATQFA